MSVRRLGLVPAVVVLLAAMKGAVPAVAATGRAPMVGSAPDASRVYVADYENNVVDVIDTGANSIIGTIHVGNSPDGIAATPDGATVYAANSIDNTVSVIDATTDTVTATIAVGQSPYAATVAPDGKHVYVPNNLAGPPTVSVIDTATNAVTATVVVGVQPTAVAVSPDSRHAYVSNSLDGTVSVVDTATDALTSTIDVGSFPTGVAVTPDGNHAYVTNGSDNTVSVIDTATNAVTATINVGSSPQGVTVAPDGGHAYVANSPDNSVSVIDTATNSVVSTIAGGGQYAVAITADGATAYAAGPGSMVTVDDLTKDSVAAGIPIGGTTFSVAIAPAPVVPVAPSITSPASATFVVGASGNFTPTATGTPAPTITESGRLPAGVSFTAGVLAGTPGAGTVGTYPLVLTAANGVGAAAKQDFTLTVAKSASAVVLEATPTSPAFGQPVSFTATVTPAAANSLAPVGKLSFFLDGAVSAVATLALRGGVASFTTSGLGAGPHQVTATYNGNRNFSRSMSLPAPVTVTTSVIVTGHQGGSIIVQPGATLLLSDAQVSGAVIVEAGGSLDMETSTAAALVANDPLAVRVCHSTLLGSAEVTGAGGLVLVGDSGDDACASNAMAGLVLIGNRGGLEAIGNQVRGAVVDFSNSGRGAFPEDSEPEVSDTGPRSRQRGIR